MAVVASGSAVEIEVTDEIYMERDRGGNNQWNTSRLEEYFSLHGTYLNIYKLINQL